MHKTFGWSSHLSAEILKGVTRKHMTNDGPNELKNDPRSQLRFTWDQGLVDLSLIEFRDLI